MSVKKTGLGRGLDALLSQPRPVVAPVSVTAPIPSPASSPSPSSTALSSAAPSPAATGDTLAKIPLDLLQRGQYQPRVDMRPESLEDLANSIKSQGVIQPIVVRPLAHTAGTGSQRYEIIAGERRWRAAQIAGLGDIPAIIRRVPDEAAVAMALIENIQRENLNPLEEARALHRLIEEFEMTHQQAADAVGRSRVAVSNLLRLLELNDDVKTLVDSRELEMGHARALLGLTVGRQQVEVARLVAKKGLSVRDTEALVRRMAATPGEGAGARIAEPTVDPNIRKLEEDLTDKLGAKVSVQHGRGGKGKVVIGYNSLDELDGILSHIN